jgi:hypothetical protein
VSALFLVEPERLIGDWCGTTIISDYLHVHNISGIDNEVCSNSNPCLTLKYTLLRSNHSTTVLDSNVIEHNILVVNMSVELYGQFTNPSPQYELQSDSCLPNSCNVPYVIGVDSSQFKIRDLKIRIMSNSDIVCIKVLSGTLKTENLLVRIANYNNGLGQILSKPIFLLEGGTTSIMKNNFNDQIFVDINSNTSLIRQSGGALQFIGVGSNYVAFSRCIQSSGADAAPFILDAQTPASDNSEITSIVLRRVRAVSASGYPIKFQNPTKNVKEGGLIKIVGLPTKRIKLIIEQCQFTVDAPDVIPDPKSVHGGVLFGAYLKYLYIEGSDFTSAVNPGTGGALYIENIETNLESMYITYKRMRICYYICVT